MKFKAFIFYGAILLFTAVVISFLVLNSNFGNGSRELNNDTVVASVDGVEIYGRAINKIILINEDDTPEEIKQKRTEILDSLINNQIYVNEANKRDIQVTDEEINLALQKQYQLHGKENLENILNQSGLTIEDFIQELREIILLEKLRKEIREELSESVSVSKAEIEKYYNDNKFLYDSSEVAHIYFNNPMPADEETTERTLEKARKIIRRLESGESFSKLAREYSDDASSKQNDGNLGPVNSGILSTSFIKAANQLSEGEFTHEPLLVQGGVHIIKKLSENYIPLEDVSEKIKSMLIVPRLENEVDQYMMDLRKNADIRILLK